MASAAAPQAHGSTIVHASRGETGKRDLVWPIGALCAVLALQFSLVFTRAINTDEFFFYHQVADFAAGQLGGPLQTIHVRLFAWLPALHANSVDAIITARMVQFGFELTTLAAIAVIARRFSDGKTALLAALAYLSAGYVFQHGTSFRVDPIVTVALMTSLALLACSRLRIAHILLLGGLAGFAGMVTIKAVLYAPAFVAIAGLRWQEADFARARFVALAACAVAALTSFALLYVWHSQALPSESGAVARGGAIVESAGGWVFFLGVPPYLAMAAKSMLIAPMLYGAILATPFMLVRSPIPTARKIALAGLWLPIITIFFYTNTAAYYYAFVLAPVTVGSIIPLRWALDRYGSRILALLLVALAAALWLTEDRETVDRQRRLVDNVQEIFPRPVTYFDENFILGNWPKGNGLMTPWGMAGYYEAGVPAYRRTLEQQIVPLIVANSQVWQDTLDGKRNGGLLPEDEAAIRANFRLHSWPLWVAGKSFPGGVADLAEEFLVPGIYTVTGGSIVMDGQEHPAGSTVEIGRGMHRISVPGDAAIVLAWGDHLPQSASPIEPGPLHVDY